MEISEIKRKIEETKRRIIELEETLADIDEKIKKAQREETHASMDATTGLFMMNNHSSLQSLGTYKYLSGTSKAGFERVTISGLERDRDFRQSQLYDERRRLQNLEEELEYLSRPEAVLIDSKDGLFIEGDNSKTNLLADVYAMLNAYVQDYNTMLSEAEVKRYCELVAQIMQSPEYAFLPKFTPMNKETLRAYAAKRPLTHVVVGDRMVVDSDFATPEINDEQAMIRYYDRKIEDEHARLEDFQPTGLAKIFPNHRQKQQEELNREVEWEVQAAERRIEHGKGKIERLEKLHKGFVVPSIPFFETVRQIAELKTTRIVRKFETEGETYRENIENHTILKNSSDYGNFIARIIFANRRILDKLGVRLSREQILELIYNSEYHAELAEELKNAGYILEQRESKKGSKPVELGE